MKEYNKPIAIINNDSFEGVFAESGDNPLWDGDGKWRDQDSGTQSSLEFHAYNKSGLRGHTITMVVQYNGPGNIWVNGYDAGGGTCSVTGNTITFTKFYSGDGYNAGESCTFALTDIRFDTPAYNPEEYLRPDRIQSCNGWFAYYPSQTHQNESIFSDNVFTITSVYGV